MHHKLSAWQTFGAMWVSSFVVCAILRSLVIPRDHWSGPIVIGSLPILLASIVTGRLYPNSQALRARHKRSDVVWNNVRREMVDLAPIPMCEVRPPLWVKIAVPGAGALMVILLGLVCITVFSGAAPQQADARSFALGMLALAAAGEIGSLVFVTRPFARIDERGISGSMVPARTWQQIAACRLQATHSANGLNEIRVTLLNDHGRTSSFSLLLDGTRPSGWREFLLALHRALQPGAPEPDLREVLGDDAANPSNT